MIVGWCPRNPSRRGHRQGTRRRRGFPPEGRGAGELEVCSPVGAIESVNGEVERNGRASSRTAVRSPSDRLMPEGLQQHAELRRVLSLRGRCEFKSLQRVLAPEHADRDQELEIALGPLLEPSDLTTAADVAPGSSRGDARRVGRSRSRDREWPRAPRPREGSAPATPATGVETPSGTRTCREAFASPVHPAPSRTRRHSRPARAPRDRNG